jgi:hypothetical protein
VEPSDRNETGDGYSCFAVAVGLNDNLVGRGDS